MQKMDIHNQPPNNKGQWNRRFLYKLLFSLMMRQNIRRLFAYQLPEFLIRQIEPLIFHLTCEYSWSDGISSPHDLYLRIFILSLWEPSRVREYIATPQDTTIFWTIPWDEILCDTQALQRLCFYPWKTEKPKWRRYYTNRLIPVHSQLLCRTRSMPWEHCKENAAPVHVFVGKTRVKGRCVKYPGWYPTLPLMSRTPLVAVEETTMDIKSVLTVSLGKLKRQTKTSCEIYLHQRTNVRGNNKMTTRVTYFINPLIHKQ